MRTRCVSASQRRTCLVIVVCLLLAALTASACGDDSAGSSASTSPTVSRPGSPTTPARSPATSAPAITKYTVKSGDTLSQIAEDLGVGLSALKTANPGIDPDVLRVGQVLNVPGVSATAARPSSSAASSASPVTASSVSTNVSLLTVVDKQHSLPADYVPPDLTAIPEDWDAPGYGGQQLRSEAAGALVQMLEAASAAGYETRVRSSYRSYTNQQSTFQYWVNTLGEEQARRVSAEPGHSEHQMGTAVDLSSASVGYDLVESFGESAEGQWLVANSYRFGLGLSYPAGKEDVTGYAYEPWHFRYVGSSAAQAWFNSGLTLVEYLRGL